MRILPRSGRIACVSRSRACLAEPPALSPSTRKISVPLGGRARAIGELAGQAQLARRGLALELALLARRRRSSARSITASSSARAALRIVGQPMVEMVLERALDQPRRLGRGEPLLGLALELRLADEQRQDRDRAGHHVLGRDLRGAAVAGQLAIGLEAARQRRAQARLVRAAFGRRHGVAVGRREALAGPTARRSPIRRGRPRRTRPRRRTGAASASRGRRAATRDNRRARRGNAASLPAARRRAAAAPDRTTSGSRRRGRDRPWRAPCDRAAPA